MPLTVLDPKTALVIIDLQKGIVTYPVAHSITEVVNNAAELAKTFRARKLPVVLVNVKGGAPGRAEQSHKLGDLPADWADIVPELDQQPSDHCVTKYTWGAFTNTDLHAYLKSQGVTQIVLAGVATSVGVESTARYAYELGYNITLAVDAMTDMRVEAHENSLARIFPRLGETGTTREVLEMLNQVPA